MDSEDDGMTINASEIIHRLALEPLSGEGGFYRETYRAPEKIPSEALVGRYSTPKSLGTAIYYLLTPDTCSLLHRLPTDEIYHFYLGDPVHMLLLHPDGSSAEITLGSDLATGQRVQVVVPKGTWQGSVLLPGGSFCLMGTTMAPGFDFSDFETGERTALMEQYPERRDLINRLT
jgi:predicted cupin superfamily sugar epimerase